MRSVDRDASSESGPPVTAPPARLAALRPGSAPWARALQRSAGNRAVGALLARQAVPTGGPITSPADLPTGRTWNVVVVGAPSRGELGGRELQFATAAARQGGTSGSTIWLVERTGYENAGVALSRITTLAGSAQVFWITPDEPLTRLIGLFPAGSIASLDAFSHGLVGLLALRYGWDEPNYGLSVAEAQLLTPAPFAPGARVSLDSCNAGTGGDGSLAQAMAQAIQHAVTAWTGRTSYREFNRPDEFPQPRVRGSEIWPDTASRPDFTELGSQLRGRHPDQFTFAPRHSPGDWTGAFSITARLPKTRTFAVAAGQDVHVTIAATSDYTHADGMATTVQLHRVDTFFDDDVDPNQEFLVNRGPHELVWRAPGAGTYYLELWHLSSMLVEGTIAVRITSPVASGTLARAPLASARVS